MNDSPAALVATRDLCSYLSLAFSYFSSFAFGVCFSLEQFISQTWRLLGILRSLSWWSFMSFYHFYINFNVNLFIYSLFLLAATILKLIRENILRTKTEGMCRWPNKRVLEMPHSATKTYMPRKYVIYQCSDDTACCGTPEKTCVAKKAEDLVLWFHVRSVS